MKNLHPSVNVDRLEGDNNVIFWSQESYFLERSFVTAIFFSLICLLVSASLFKYTSILLGFLPLVVILWICYQYYRDIQESKAQKGRLINSLHRELRFFKEAISMLQYADAFETIPPVIENGEERYQRMNHSIGEEYTFDSINDTGDRLKVYKYVFQLAGVIK